MQALADVFGPMMEKRSPPELIAEVIYGAATDGTDQLRYVAGADAVHILAARRAADDATFFAGIEAQFRPGA
jgi:hypothetical protein